MKKNISLWIEEKDLQDLKEQARLRCFAPCAYGRSLLVRALRQDIDDSQRRKLP